MREGKGFSRGELKEAGMDFKQALRMAIPIDARRKTKHKGNIEILNSHLQNLKPQGKARAPKSRKTSTVRPR